MTQYIVMTTAPTAPPRRHRPVGETLEGHSDCGLLSAAADRYETDRSLQTPATTPYTEWMRRTARECTAPVFGSNAIPTCLDRAFPEA
jgi:hypothetical protein